MLAGAHVLGVDGVCAQCGGLAASMCQDPRGTGP